MEEKFLADVMLGRLARWLRALGYDAIYSKRGIDSRLMVDSYRDNRIIITRDKKLYKKLGNKLAIFINSDDFREQVSEVIKTLGLKLDDIRPFTRCVECNIPLAPVKKEDAELKVPPYIFHTKDSFKTCPHCKRIYWSGSHIDEMEKLINTFWRKHKTGPRPDAG